MYSTQVMVCYSSNDSFGHIRLPKKLAQRWNLKNGTFIRINCSTQTVSVQCQVNHSKSPLVYVDSHSALKLGLHDQSRWHILYKPSSYTIQLGPILSILVAQSADDNPSQEIDNFLKEVLYQARVRHVPTFVSSLKDFLQADDHHIQGWTLVNGLWRKVSHPLPHAVYNRIQSRKIENSTDFEQVKNLLKEKNIALYNETFLNKWEVYEHLKTNPSLTPYLPQTCRLDFTEACKKLLKAYPVLFVKPIHGSLGQGIYRISRRQKGFECKYTTLNGEIQKHFRSPARLYRFLSRRLRLHNFIIQQGIPILQYQQRTIDIRVLVQKNAHNRWQVTSMIARLGPIHRFVSNIAQGGEMMSVKEVLQKTNLDQPAKTRSQLMVIAKWACQTIEKAHPGHFAEFGVDLAVTPDGKIYILEVNSKPSKTDDSIRISTKKGRPSVRKLFEYTLYTTQFKKK